MAIYRVSAREGRPDGHFVRQMKYEDRMHRRCFGFLVLRRKLSRQRGKPSTLQVLLMENDVDLTCFSTGTKGQLFSEISKRSIPSTRLVSGRPIHLRSQQRRLPQTATLELKLSLPQQS